MWEDHCPVPFFEFRKSDSFEMVPSDIKYENLLDSVADRTNTRHFI